MAKIMGQSGRLCCVRLQAPQFSNFFGLVSIQAFGNSSRDLRNL